MQKTTTAQTFRGKNLLVSPFFSNFASDMPFPIHLDILDFISKLKVYDALINRLILTPKVKHLFSYR